MSSPTMSSKTQDTDAGAAEYHNSSTHSDITIHYGDRTFFSHRVLLCMNMRWFKKALESEFREAKEKDITLQDDKPTALEGMFAYLYGKKISFPTADTSAANVVFCIELFRVADKYIYSHLISAAPDMFNSILTSLLNDLAELEESLLVDATKALSEIVQAVYDFEDTAWAGHEQSPIKKRRVDEIFGNKLTSPLGEAGKADELSGAVTAVAKKVPEFGQDLHLELMARDMGSHGEAGWVDAVKLHCYSCGSNFVHSPVDGWSGDCWYCGRSHRDWDTKVLRRRPSE